MAGAPIGNTNNIKNKVWSDVLRKHSTQNPQELIEVAKALFAKAKEGDVAAAKEIGDRIEGKVAQQTILAGDEDNPINVTHGLSETLIGLLNQIKSE
jgi:hypothetical protein